MAAGELRVLGVSGNGGTGFWASVPERDGAPGTDLAHWHPSVRVTGINGFAGSSASANLWVEGLEEFVNELSDLLDGR